MPNFSIKKQNTFGIDATAHRVTHARWANEFVSAFMHSQIESKKLFIIGKGSNVLFLKDFCGEIVINECSGIKLSLSDDFYKIYVNSGVEWNYLVEWTLKLGINGLENMAGIPGTIGGAIVGNIGAYGKEIKDYCHHVDLIDLRCGDIISLTKNDCKFSYRNSIFKKDYLDGYAIIGVELNIPKKWQPDLRYEPLKILADKKILTAKDIYQHIINLRNSKLPDTKKFGSAGSFFTNPIIDQSQANLLIKQHPNIPIYPIDNDKLQLSAAWLIEQSGLKGKKIGGAQVYEKQSLIIINYNNATSDDIVKLASLIQSTVFKKYNIMLSPEVRFYGAGGEINACEYLQKISKEENY